MFESSRLIYEAMTERIGQDDVGAPPHDDNDNDDDDDDDDSDGIDGDLRSEDMMKFTSMENLKPLGGTVVEFDTSETTSSACNGGGGGGVCGDGGGATYETTTQSSKRRCDVCKGLATGYHYGVASCEACKAFFKRTVQKKLSYSCLETRRCEISHGKRRTCQACRYEKCIQAGMLINGVRLNRNKGGRQEYRRRPDERDFSPATSGKKRKHKLALEFSKRMLEIEPEMLKIKVPDEIKKCFKSGGEKDPASKLPGMQMMAEIADKALITTVRWAKKIPGFDKMCLNDQMALLCNSWMEILLINVIYRNSLLPASVEGGGSVILVRGLAVCRDDTFLPHRVSSPLIFEQIMNVVDRLRPLKLSKAIVVILKAMVLFNSAPSLSNRLPLKSQKELQEIQSTIHDALHYRIQQEHPGDTRLVYHLMMLLPLIKDTALTISSLVWSEFNREQVPMQELLREVLQPILQTSERHQCKTHCHGDQPEASSSEQSSVNDRIKLENSLSCFPKAACNTA